MSRIDISANRNCYALAWSYGEICVGCGCCSTNKKKRIKARIKYHEDLLRDCRNFNFWDDNPEWRAAQERKIAEDINHHEKCLRKLREELRQLEK